METKDKPKRTGLGLVILILFFTCAGGWGLPKIYDAILKTYQSTRQQILISWISTDLDGKAFDIDPQRRHQMIAPMMERNDLLKALYVLDLRYRQSKIVLDGVRDAAAWDGTLGGEE